MKSKLLTLAILLVTLLAVGCANPAGPTTDPEVAAFEAEWADLVAELNAGRAKAICDSFIGGSEGPTTVDISDLTSKYPRVFNGVASIPTGTLLRPATPPATYDFNFESGSAFKHRLVLSSRFLHDGGTSYLVGPPLTGYNWLTLKIYNQEDMSAPLKTYAIGNPNIYNAPALF